MNELMIASSTTQNVLYELSSFERSDGTPDHVAKHIEEVYPLIYIQKMKSETVILM